MVWLSDGWFSTPETLGKMIALFTEPLNDSDVAMGRYILCFIPAERNLHTWKLGEIGDWFLP